MRSLCLFLIVAVFSCGPLFAAEPYQGPLFDAYAHLSNKSDPQQAQRHILDVGFDKVALFVEVGRIDEVVDFAQDKFLVFVDPFKRKKVKTDKGK